MSTASSMQAPIKPDAGRMQLRRSMVRHMLRGTPPAGTLPCYIFFCFAQVRGSGPWGLPLPWETRKLLDQVQAALAPHWPRLQQLAALPGAIEVCLCHW
jgi:hypothetical protein